MLPSFAELSLNYAAQQDEPVDEPVDELVNELVQAFPTPSLTPPMAQRVVTRGSVAFSLVVTGGRVADLLVDLNGVSSVATYSRLRSLIGDSWIMTSSALVPYTGKMDVTTAIIRAAVMLIAKRIWKIQQFAPVREAIVIMHFAALAGKFLANRNQPLSDALVEMSTVPIMVYTAIAEVIRNAGIRLQDALYTQLLAVQHVRTPIPPPRCCTAGRLRDLEQEWARSVPVVARRALRDFAATNSNSRYDNLVEWQGVFEP